MAKNDVYSVFPTNNRNVVISRIRVKVFFLPKTDKQDYIVFLTNGRIDKPYVVLRLSLM